MSLENPGTPFTSLGRFLSRAPDAAPMLIFLKFPAVFSLDDVRKKILKLLYVSLVDRYQEKFVKKQNTYARETENFLLRKKLEATPHRPPHPDAKVEKKKWRLITG